MNTRNLISLAIGDEKNGHNHSYTGKVATEYALIRTLIANHTGDIAKEIAARTHFGFQIVKLQGAYPRASYATPAPATPAPATTAIPGDLTSLTLADLEPMRVYTADLLTRIDAAIAHRKARSASASASRSKAQGQGASVTAGKGKAHPQMSPAIVCPACGIMYSGSHACKAVAGQATSATISAPIATSPKLSVQHTAILKRVAQGETWANIATAMRVSVDTVKADLATIAKDHGIKANAATLSVLAAKLGLV